MSSSSRCYDSYLGASANWVGLAVDRRFELPRVLAYSLSSVGSEAAKAVTGIDDVEVGYRARLWEAIEE